MKRIALILIAALFVAGCGRFGRKGRVIQPDEEYPTSAPATQPARPAALPPARQDSTVPPSPSPYRVLGKPEVVAAALLQVNDKFITLDEVLRPIRPKLAEAAAAMNENAFRAKALELIREEVRRQVEQALLLAEAENYLTDAEKKQVDEQVAGRIRQAVAEMGGSRKRLDQHLRGEGTNLADWRENLRSALLIHKYLRARLDKRIAVDRRMMWDYYVAHRKEFCKADSVQMQIISVVGDEFLPKDRKPTDSDRQEARRKARKLAHEAAAALADGKDFAEVARTFSQGPMAKSGGVWPLMERGSFRAEAVEETAFAQGVGRKSKVIETPQGLYIVKTLAVRAGEKLPFEQVQDRIAGKLRLQQFGKLAMEYRAKLYGKATIIAADRFERLAVDAAVRRFYKRS